jgi:hypothetical protein
MELYYPPKPKSKLEEYNLKLKERELYTNNILDRFTQNGSGSPIKNIQGKPVTKRKAILENIKYINEDNPQQNNPNININEEDNNINISNIFQKQKMLLPVQAEQFELFPQNNYINDNDNDNIQNQEDIKLEGNNQCQNLNRKTTLTFEENYKGVGILPYVSDFPQIKQKMKLDSYKDEIANAIKEKKIRKEKEMKRQLELDLKEEEKVKKALEEEQRLLKIEKKKKEEEENRLRLANLQKMENQKKKKKLIDIDEYYGKDFREYQKNKKNLNSDNSNENNEESDIINDTKNNNKKRYIQNNNNIYTGADIRNHKMKINIARDIQKSNIDALQQINNFSINVYKNRQMLDNDIKNLRKELRNDYIEMNTLFKELKDTSAQADFNKNYLLQKSNILKEELLQSNIKHTLTKNLLKQNYDENMNVNVDELEAKNNNDINNINQNIISKNSNLPGTSDFLYINASDIPENENDMSYLAKTGQNIIELKGEGEQIPFNEENKEYYKNKYFIDLGLNDRDNFYYIDYLKKKNFYDEMHKECKMEDLYKELEGIEKINRKLAPINKIHTLKSNFSVDYDRILTKEKNIKEKFGNKL